MKFHKYHALGNVYLILETAEPPTPERVRTLCHCHYGLGADGVLTWAKRGNGNDTAGSPPYALRIFNPDGSEAEKSGNGLRIFARYLWDTGRVSMEPFAIQTLGGTVTAQVHSGDNIAVEMGRVSFDSREIPLTGPPREVIDETLTIDGCTFRYCAATIGNPHCVILLDTVSAEVAKRWGHLIETHASFPNRTNVQFMQLLDRANIRIEIWERGAGYTLASGSSSCAAAAVAHRLGLCAPDVTVHMPGGTLHVTVGENDALTLRGPATQICSGTLSGEIFEASRPVTA